MTLNLPSDLVSMIVPLPRALPPVLGVGAYLKNTLCLIQGNEAWISRDNGSLDSVEAITRFQETAQAMIEGAREKPVLIAHDWHPDFPCTRWALKSGLKAVAIQHHHAHAAAVMAEHGTDGPVLALTLDGFGLGENNEAWGGELLRVDTSGFARLGHLLPLHQPGGDSAARQPWRMGAAALFAMGQGAKIAERFKGFDGANHLGMMMERGINAPLTSSAGRLFDAACGLLGVLPVASFEGEAPMKLESMVTVPQIMHGGWRFDGNVLDMRPLLARLMDCGAEEGANLFHGTLTVALLEWLQKACADTGIKQVALCGGCFFNKVLRESLGRGMISAGLTPLLPKQMSVGDPAIALGQAYAAAMKLGE